MFYSFCFLKSCQRIMEKTSLEKSTQRWSILSGAQGQLCIFETKQLHGTIQPWHLRTKTCNPCTKRGDSIFSEDFGGVSDSTRIPLMFPCAALFVAPVASGRMFPPASMSSDFFLEIHRYRYGKKGLYWKTVISRILCSLIHLLIYLDSIISGNRLPILPNCHAFHWYLQASCRSKSSSLVV